MMDESPVTQLFQVQLADGVFMSSVSEANAVLARHHYLGTYRGYRSDMVDPKPAREWPVSALLKGGLIRWAKHHGISLPRKGAACQAPDVHQAGESCRTCWNEGRKLNAEYVRENYGDIPFPLEVEVA